MESTFYRRIVGVDRFFAEYFRVGYYGKGFESSIQVSNKSSVINYSLLNYTRAKNLFIEVLS